MEYSLQELKTCPYYFFQWIRDLNLTTERIEDMSCLLQPMSDTFEDDLEIFDTLQMLTIQNAVVPFIHCFLDIMSGDSESVKGTLIYIGKLIPHLRSKDFINADYLPGFEFMSTLVKAHVSAMEGISLSLLELKNESCQEVKELQRIESLFDKLKPKGKAIVIIGRWMMNEAIRERKEEALEDLREVIQLDGDNWVFQYLLCSRRRFLRRNIGGNPSSLPTEEEIGAAMNALKLTTDTMFNLICNAAVCQCLAEIARFRIRNNEASLKVNVGELSFHNTDEMINYIKDAASDAFMEVNCCFAEFIRYGEILGIILPKPHRDYKLAVACMRCAFLLAPSNSKVNHKMGVLILAWKNEIKKATKFLQRAVMQEPHNIPAWADFIPALLTNYEENETLLAKLWDVVKTIENEWAEHERTFFTFYEGCISFLKGERQIALGKWLETVSSESVNFKGFTRIKQRFGWPKSHNLNFEAILETIETGISNGNFDLKDLKLLKETVFREKQEEDANNYRRERNRSGEKNRDVIHGQPKWRNPNSSSPADSDNTWRRPSLTTAAPNDSSFNYQRTRQNSESYAYNRKDINGDLSENRHHDHRGKFDNATNSRYVIPRHRNSSYSESKEENWRKN